MLKEEAKLIGEILANSDTNLSDYGVSAEQLLDGNASCLTYKEMQFVLNENPTTRSWSEDLKQKLQTSKLLTVLHRTQ